MIEALRSQLTAEGVPAAQIHAEEFGFAKVGRGSPGAPVVVETTHERELARIPRDRRSGAQATGALLFAALVFAAGLIVGRHTAPTQHAAAETQPVPGSPSAGKAVFTSAGCGACHALEDAGAKGNVGPNLDELGPSAEVVADAVAHGKGAMPLYAGKLTDTQIRDVSAYVAEAAGG